MLTINHLQAMLHCARPSLHILVLHAEYAVRLNRLFSLLVRKVRWILPHAHCLIRVRLPGSRILATLAHKVLFSLLERTWYLYLSMSKDLLWRLGDNAVPRHT